MIKAIAISAAIAISIYGGYQIVGIYKENKMKQEYALKREKDQFISQRYEDYKEYAKEDPLYDDNIYGYGDVAAPQ